MAQATGELEKVNQKRIKSAQDTEKAKERQRLAEIKLAQDRERAFDKYEKQLLRESERQIKESEKIIRQKEKEFREFEKQFNKYEADLRKKAIEEERAKKATVQAILDESKAIQSLQRQKEKALKDAEREEAKLKTAAKVVEKFLNKSVKIHGPYAQRARTPTGKCKDIYSLDINNRNDVYALTSAIWPYVNNRRKEKFIEFFNWYKTTEYVSYKRKSNGR